jgi:uncharacterized membrane protein (UPF0127 family)
MLYNKYMKIVINKIELDVKVAKSFKDKLFGLTNKNSYPNAMLFYNTNVIHTFGMKMDIDVIYLDKDYNVISFLTNVPKNKVLMPVKGTHHVIEIDSKIINNYQLQDIKIIKNKIQKRVNK